MKRLSVLLLLAGIMSTAQVKKGKLVWEENFDGKPLMNLFGIMNWVTAAPITVVLAMPKNKFTLKQTIRLPMAF